MIEEVNSFFLSFPGELLSLCYAYGDAETCTLPLRLEGEEFTTKELCCATIGEAWGEKCELCATFKSDCDSGFLPDENGKCVGEYTSFGKQKKNQTASKRN